MILIRKNSEIQEGDYIKITQPFLWYFVLGEEEIFMILRVVKKHKVIWESEVLYSLYSQVSKAGEIYNTEVTYEELAYKRLVYKISEKEARSLVMALVV